MQKIVSPIVLGWAHHGDIFELTIRCLPLGSVSGGAVRTFARRAAPGRPCRAPEILRDLVFFRVGRGCRCAPRATWAHRGWAPGPGTQGSNTSGDAVAENLMVNPLGAHPETRQEHPPEGAPMGAELGPRGCFMGGEGRGSGREPFKVLHLIAGTGRR